MVPSLVSDSVFYSRSAGTRLYRPQGWLFPGGTAAGHISPDTVCPACWPAYAGVLSSLGLGFLLKTTCLLPLTGLFLLIAAGSLAFRAGLRRGYSPFALGLVASAVVMIGKFVIVSDSLTYGGIAVLIAASVWNAWPRRITGVCPACAPGGQASRPHLSGAKEVSS